MREVSKISSRDFHIGIYMCHGRVYVLWLALICTIFRSLIYFCWYVCLSFSLLHVSVYFLIRSVQFRKICDEMILRYTSEARIWFPPIAFIKIFIVVTLIEGNFFIALSLYLFIEAFLSWALSFTVTAPWLSRICSLVICHWIFQIQIINFQVTYRYLFFINKFLFSPKFWLVGFYLRRVISTFLEIV